MLDLRPNLLPRRHFFESLRCDMNRIVEQEAVDPPVEICLETETLARHPGFASFAIAR
jgi:hypothetical protein